MRSFVVIAVVMIVVMMVRVAVIARCVKIFDFRYRVAYVHGDVLNKMILAAECLGGLRVLEREFGEKKHCEETFHSRHT